MMTPEMWCLFVIVSLFFGFFGGMLVGMKLRGYLYTRFWIQVEPEYEFQVMECIKMMNMCKKSVVYATPALYLNQDGTLKVNSAVTTFIIELSNEWFKRAIGYSPNEQKSRGN